MVHALVITDPPRKVIFWNIEGNVGAYSPNRQDDVDLVQMGYVALAKSPLAKISEATRQLAKQIVPGARCDGTPNDPLVKVIKSHQADRGGTQDGHVSVISSTSGSYDGQHAFLLVILNNNIALVSPEVFPRMDKIPGCPPTLAAKVREACTR